LRTTTGDSASLRKTRGGALSSMGETHTSAIVDEARRIE
jgi:hypothetical protein